MLFNQIHSLVYRREDMSPTDSIIHSVQENMAPTIAKFLA